MFRQIEQPIAIVHLVSCPPTLILAFPWLKFGGRSRCARARRSAAGCAAGMPRLIRRLAVACALAPAAFAAAGGSPCALWLAESALEGAGRGVFAGRRLAGGEVLAVARRLPVPKATAEATQLSDYVFADAGAGAGANGEGPQHSLLMLGAASMVNHAGPDAVNAQVNIISFIIILIA